MGEIAMHLAEVEIRLVVKKAWVMRVWALRLLFEIAHSSLGMIL